MEWYLGPLRKFATFTGRARRKEYWLFILLNYVVLFVLAVIDNILGTTMQDLPYGFITLLYSLVLMIPLLALNVRRMHDLGKSGWWLFITLVPFVGGIWYFVLTVTAGEKGDNQYGPDPKAAG